MIFVDANVLLEVLLGRERKDLCAAALTSGNDKAISVLTLDLVMYFAERDKLPLPSVKTFLESFVWLPVTEADAQTAYEYHKGADYEDALQVACAMREGCKEFLTLDAGLHKKYRHHTPITLLR